MAGIWTGQGGGAYAQRTSDNQKYCCGTCVLMLDRLISSFSNDILRELQ